MVNIPVLACTAPELLKTMPLLTPPPLVLVPPVFSNVPALLNVGGVPPSKAIGVSAVWFRSARVVENDAATHASAAGAGSARLLECSRVAERRGVTAFKGDRRVDRMVPGGPGQVVENRPIQHQEINARPGRGRA